MYRTEILDPIGMEQILYDFRRGDERAFKKLFDHFFKPACSFVGRFIVAEEVEDIVQETFIGIWKKRDIFTDLVYFKAYLYKALYNNTLYYLRQQKPGEEMDAGLIDHTANVLKMIVSEEVHREIIQAIEKLPSQRKKIIQLSLEDLSPEEIARALSISINTVKTQKRKAYAFLREELQELFTVFLFLIGTGH